MSAKWTNAPLPEFDGPSHEAERYEKFVPGLTLERFTPERLEVRTRRFINGLGAAAAAEEDVNFF